MKNTLKIIRLTPAGRGAVASLLLTGSGAAEIFRRHWAGKNPLTLETPPENKPLFGKIRLNNNRQTEVFEEAVVHFISPEEIEIHCHGGTAVVESVQKVFLAEGAVDTNWTEHFCSGENQHDAALQMLPFAETERIAQILLSQMNGALEKELKKIAGLPDGEEKQRYLERLRKKEVLGQHLIRPFSVVLAGEVNAGKSSLLNAILGFHRVITDVSPGTTRDTVSVKTAINGFPFEFSDTAGFRSKEPDSANPVSLIEQEGIKRSEVMLTNCDLFIWVMDCGGLDRNEQPIPAAAFEPKMLVSKMLMCVNKIDLLPQTEPISPDNVSVYVSAATGEGIEKLLQTVFERLIPCVPELDEGVPLAGYSDKYT